MFNINIVTLILSFPEGADILANTLDKSQSLPSGHSQRPHIVYKISVFSKLIISLENLPHILPNLCSNMHQDRR